ncbi:MAG: sigma-70 family RNA polymerase sigma factor [Candidatus Eisenbacteria bacterium]
MDDETLVQRSLTGDHSAFAELVKRYERPLFHVALRTLRDHEEARDATQSAFVKAWLNLAQFDRTRRFFSWIYRITLNESLNRLRDRRPAEPLDERLVDGGVTPEDQVAGRERSEQLERAMARLTDKQREVIVLRHVLQLSYDEIADALQLPARTVKSRLFSARTRLGEILHDMGVALPPAASRSEAP